MWGPMWLPLVTWQHNNRNRNVGFLMSIVSIRTIPLRATETKGLAFKIYDLKRKLHFFGKVQMYFIQLCCYSQSLVVNKSHIWVALPLTVFILNRNYWLHNVLCVQKTATKRKPEQTLITEELKHLQWPACKVATVVNFMDITLKSWNSAF